MGEPGSKPRVINPEEALALKGKLSDGIPEMVILLELPKNEKELYSSFFCMQEGQEGVGEKRFLFLELLFKLSHHNLTGMEARIIRAN
jgi:hypothetical protein